MEDTYIKDFVWYVKENIRKAYASGAVAEDVCEAWVVTAVIHITANEQQYRARDYKKFRNNLSHFI